LCCLHFVAVWYCDQLGWWSSPCKEIWGTFVQLFKSYLMACLCSKRL